jgi:hypothetical protein
MIRGMQERRVEMKLSRLGICLLFCLPAFPQNGFTTMTADEPISWNYDPKSCNAAGQCNIGLTGHWIGVDKHSEPTGPSVSELFCERLSRVCEESSATMTVFPDKSFTLTADHTTYAIKSWTDKEIIAFVENVGICKMTQTVQIDIASHRVFWIANLPRVPVSLPKMSQDICNASNLRMELKGDAVFVVGKDPLFKETK